MAHNIPIGSPRLKEFMSSTSCCYLFMCSSSKAYPRSMCNVSLNSGLQPRTRPFNLQHALFSSSLLIPINTPLTPRLPLYLLPIPFNVLLLPRFISTNLASSCVYFLALDAYTCGLGSSYSMFPYDCYYGPFYSFPLSIVPCFPSTTLVPTHF